MLLTGNFDKDGPVRRLDVLARVNMSGSKRLSWCP